MPQSQRLSDDSAGTPADDDFDRLERDVHACFACGRVAHSHVLSEANGSLDATVLFVAEAVGRRGGAITGVPLTRDESGKRFTAFLELASIGREDAFVTNAVLCNPLDSAGHNRRPTPAEIARCRPFLLRTLEAVRAPIVVALGRVALESLRSIEPHAADLSRDVATPVAWSNRILIPMYHPSRQSTLHRAQAAQNDDWRTLGKIVGSHRS
jgi:uracil-DNA glycosylase family 4